MLNAYLGYYITREDTEDDKQRETCAKDNGKSASNQTCVSTQETQPHRLESETVNDSNGTVVRYRETTTATKAVVIRRNVSMQELRENDSTSRIKQSSVRSKRKAER